MGFYAQIKGNEIYEKLFFKMSWGGVPSDPLVTAFGACYNTPAASFIILAFFTPTF